MQKKNSQKRVKKIKFKLGLDDFIAAVLIIFGVFIPSINLLIYKLPSLRNLFSDIRGELIGIGIGVLLINNAAEHMEYVAEEKRKNISKAGSSDNSLASDGIKNLREYGWLNDGTMSGYRYSNANWQGLDLSEAKLSSTDLQSADLSHAKLIDVDLSGSSLRNADLDGTILSNVNLKGTDLSGIHFEDAKFININYDEQTKWPNNFDPEEHLRDGILTVENQNGDYGIHLDFYNYDDKKVGFRNEFDDDDE